MTADRNMNLKKIIKKQVVMARVNMKYFLLFPSL